ncbi:histone-like nucleoid-structuring protein Lsr2 [Haloglycomyces albus]|uniref:histone-like nucleoid-structuring protein Lsr2 n=1 Tax=Haloglycomyces albus TaxID=526067 RepID=UPI00046D93FE|nr:Lsr2 family protein [Haloglycomyces albus]
MVKQHKVILIDDLDNSEGDETVRFGIDGDAYEIDLSAANASELRNALAKYQAAGTRLGRYSVDPGRGSRRRSRRQAPTVDREQNKAIREWAEQKGYQIAPRGRIPGDVVAAFHADKAST